MFNQQDQFEQFQKFLVALDGNITASKHHLFKKDRVDDSTEFGRIYTGGSVDNIELLNDPVDVYFTPNLFKANEFRRTKENVQFLTCMWQDLDNCTVEQAEELLTLSKLPKPSAMVSSGGGIHLYWLLEKGYRLKKTSYIDNWLLVMKGIAEKLKDALPENSEIIVDTKVLEPARIMRVPGSYNSKRDAYCQFVYFDSSITYNFINDFHKIYGNPKYYRMRELEEKYRNEPRPSGNIKIRRVTKEELAAMMADFYARQAAREERLKNPTGRVNHYNKYLREDIVRLVSLRSGNMEGCRNSVLRYLYYLGETPDRIKYVNTLFSEPLTDNEVDSIVSYERKENQFPRRYTIFSDLSVTVAEEKKMAVLLRESVATDKKRILRKISNIAGTVQKATNELKSLYIGAWAVSGLRQSEIIAKLDCNRCTITRHKKNWGGTEVYMDKKMELLKTLITVTEELVETITLIMIDPALSDRLEEAQQEAKGLLDKVTALREVVEDCSEYHEFVFDVQKLEEKSIAMWKMTTK